MPERLGLITTALGVAVAAALEECTSITAMLRWPNDIMVERKKLAGILVESVTHRGAVEALVAGIGINIRVTENDFPAELRPTATSIVLVTRADIPDRSQILGAVLERIEEMWARLAIDPDAIVAAATTRSAVLGREVVVRFADGSTATGTAHRLAPGGGLEISIGGVHRVLESAEIVRIET
jgi:BirA family transcriptional regulator, biotin operon repressor / biotin---[acetyl-CoA-carboxylase] ligase